MICSIKSELITWHCLNSMIILLKCLTSINVLNFCGIAAIVRQPHVVDGVLDFQAVRLAYCFKASKLKAGNEQETSRSTCCGLNQPIRILLTTS